MLVIVLIVGVIAMNVSVIRDVRAKEQGIMYVFKSRKLYLWFVPLAAIFFLVFLFNV